MRKIRKIEAVKPAETPKKKVAAYCRVSLQSERLDHSFATQTSYYNKLISSNPEWEFAGIYADHGITGTVISKRKGFQEMIQDALAGKFDLILAKSITRFARNTVDLLETVRLLKDKGVEVRFEKENISTMTDDGELMLTILASFVQEESRSIGQNIRWAHQKKMQQGKTHCHFNLYGYRWQEDELIPVPEEAKVVERIFYDYAHGKSLTEIRNELNAEGYRTRTGEPWSLGSIRNITRNILYTGNLVLQREFVVDAISKKCKKNEGEFNQYYVENHHPAVVSQEIFDAVQPKVGTSHSVINNRRQPTVTYKTREDYIPYKEILRCGSCGCHLRIDKSYGNGHKEHYTALCPNGYTNKNSECAKVRFNIKILNGICEKITGEDVIDYRNIQEYFQNITVYPDKRMELKTNEGDKLTQDFSNITCRNLKKYKEGLLDAQKR